MSHERDQGPNFQKIQFEGDYERTVLEGLSEVKKAWTGFKADITVAQIQVKNDHNIPVRMEGYVMEIPISTPRLQEEVVKYFIKNMNPEAVSGPPIRIDWKPQEWSKAKDHTHTILYTDVYPYTPLSPYERAQQTAAQEKDSSLKTPLKPKPELLFAKWMVQTGILSDWKVKDPPDEQPTQRLLFARWLVRTGKLSEPKSDQSHEPPSAPATRPYGASISTMVDSRQK